MRPLRSSICALLALAAAGCAAGDAPNTIRVATPAFGYGSAMPATYTCASDNTSPPLGWDRFPPDAQSLVLLVEDRDDRFTHWLVYDIPTKTGGVAEGTTPEGGKVGTNDFGAAAYGGPCPEPGTRHRYLINLYALDAELGLPAGASRDQVEEAMKGHVLARGELMGTYTRR